MTSLYNVYHSSVMSDDKAVINSNDRIRKIVEQAKREMASTSDESATPAPEGEDGEAAAAEAEPDNEALRQQILAERDEIIEKAESDAESIISKAKEEADGLFEHTAEEASKKGYNDGLVQGQSEYQQKLDALDQRSSELEQDYQNRLSSIEKDVLDTVLDIVSKAFNIEFSDDSDLLLHQIDDCLNHIENSKELLVRVNEKNYPLLMQKKDEITDRLGEGVKVEFARDPVLGDGQGMIETDGGVYDVSIDTEFKNLIRKIRLLSI